MSFAASTSTHHSRSVRLTSDAPRIIEEDGREGQPTWLRFEWTDDKAPNFVEVSAYKVKKDGEVGLTSYVAGFILRAPEKFTSAYEVAPEWIQELVNTR